MISSRRTLLAGAVALAGGLLWGSARMASADEARQILLNSLRPRVHSYVGTQVTEVSGPDGRKTYRQQVYHKGRILRINHVDTGAVLFDDGQTHLFYQPNKKVVEKGPSRLRGERREWQRHAIRNGKIKPELLGEDTVAGRAAHVLTVTGSRGPDRKLWIDKATFLQLRMDMSLAAGRRVSTYFTDLNYHQDPPAAMLAYTPPAGVQVVERGANRSLSPDQAAKLAAQWGGLLEPAFVPAEYKFRGYYRHEYKGADRLVAVYIGPGGEGRGRGRRRRSVLTVFQGPTLGMGGMAEQQQHLNVVSGKKGRAEIAVVGALPEEELKKVLDSIPAR